MWLSTTNTSPGATRAPILLLFFYGAVHAALNLDGSRAVKPATRLQDDSPIDDMNAYHPDQHDCPLPCTDYANVHSWITYLSTDRLRRCGAPMLLHFSASRALAETSTAETTNIIRACTLASLSTSATRVVESESPAGEPYAHKIENPKLSEKLFEVGVETAAACAAKGIRVSEKPSMAKSGDASSVGGRQLAGLVEGMGLYFADENNCDENLVFAYHDGAVSGAYIGAGLGKTTISSALEALADDLASGADGKLAEQTVVELCSKQRQEPIRILGIIVDAKGDLDSVRKTALNWRQGKCAADSDGDLHSAGSLAGAEVFDIAGAPLNVNGTASTSSETAAFHSRFREDAKQDQKRSTYRGIKSRADTCDYIQVRAGDGCPSLVTKCGITAQEFVRFNPKPGLCGSLQENDYVCCSAGEPYTPPKPDAPEPGEDGTCATHIIKDGDTCDSLALQHGITVEDIVKWNKGKTWAWHKCEDMLQEYSMCLSSGNPPMPPEQEGTACGPLVPGTRPPSGGTSLADLNPCPLKACCSNWGFCGVFPAHCDVNAPDDAGPGVKFPDAPSSCVSNCGTKIKENSGPPSSFGRIGYYESWNLGRDCLWMKSEDANVDGSYTHMHWGFIDIDPQTWKPVIDDPHDQWEGFKNLPDMKRVISLGGWAASTEQPKAGILRRAIIDNRDTFASNLAQFAEDEGLDGIDIDWEYPGAPDIYSSDGEVLGKQSDGLDYLKFLTSLKQKVPEGVEVSIAAPASYWYLKAFPIDRIASVIDYIVYMTYDLHGQWDYGNPNAFDQCDSGKCIRSHVNITETRNALGMITKAGVPNNKIFVGESSYGRSFRMAQNGCWGPLCDFTGSRNESDAKPGRCTGTGGYLANAEIEEIIRRGGSTRVFRDATSDSDIMLYEGDYVSYMTAATKTKRREEWEGGNFAGSIDWAVDLQFFGDADMSDTIDVVADENGDTCVSGVDETVSTGDLCEFSCSLGFCPEPLCFCESYGSKPTLPDETDNSEYVGVDEFDVDLGRLCKFGCKHGYCPSEICYKVPKDDNADVMAERNNSSIRDANKMTCLLFKRTSDSEGYEHQCYAPCRSIVEDAIEEDRVTNYGCAGFFPGTDGIPWQYHPGMGYFVNGECVCDHWLINTIAETVLEAMPIIAQIGCYILFSALKLVLDVALDAFGAGRVLSAGLDMAATAAQMANYIYDEDNDPFGAFEWWLSPCGDTSLVPDEVREIFDILSMVTGDTSFKPPRNIDRGSGRKGDNGNPPDSDRGNPGNSGPAKPKPKCNVRSNQSTMRVGKARNTLREQSCVNDKTHREEWVMTTVTYAANAQPTAVTKSCEKPMGQACYHYSSVIRENPQYATLTCPPEAATTGRKRVETGVTGAWSRQHRGAGWMGTLTNTCDRDEYPPTYLLGSSDPAVINAGQNANGQLIRFLPATENRKGGGMWKNACFAPVVKDLSDSEIKSGTTQPGSAPIVANTATGKKKQNQIQTTTKYVSKNVSKRPEFSITSWFQSRSPLRRDGLEANTCWPRARAGQDPGFTLFTFDKFYNGQAPPYDYQAPYVQGQNGS